MNVGDKVAIIEVVLLNVQWSSSLYGNWSFKDYTGSHVGTR